MLPEEGEINSVHDFTTNKYNALVDASIDFEDNFTPEGVEHLFSNHIKKDRCPSLVPILVLLPRVTMQQQIHNENMLESAPEKKRLF